MNINLDELPWGRQLFDRLRKGEHIGESAPKLHRALSEHFETFRELFDYLGFELQRHDRWFYYFEGDGSSRKLGKRAQRISVFFFVFVDALSSRGEDVIEVLFRPEGHRIDNLPHLERAQHRECLAGVDVEDTEDLQRVVRSMARYNFVQRLGDGAFRVCEPAWRFLELCFEYVDESEQ